MAPETFKAMINDFCLCNHPRVVEENYSRIVESIMTQ
jgi:hypothetical protein